MKRIVFVSDLHCGAYTGLTPPFAQISKNDHTKIFLRQSQIENWNWYKQTIKKIKNGKQTKTIVVSMGDLLQGKDFNPQHTDREYQKDIAIKCLSELKADKFLFVRGTARHVSNDGEEWENLIASHFDAPIQNELYFTVKNTPKSMKGLSFYCRHKIGRSTIKHTKFTAIARKAVEKLISGWGGHNPVPKVFLFGHVHYYAHCDDADFDAFACPPLCLSIGDGTKIFDGTCSHGILYIDVEDGKIIHYVKMLNELKNINPKEIVI